MYHLVNSMEARARDPLAHIACELDPASKFALQSKDGGVSVSDGDFAAFDDSTP